MVRGGRDSPDGAAGMQAKQHGETVQAGRHFRAQREGCDLFHSRIKSLQTFFLVLFWFAAESMNE